MPLAPLPKSRKDLCDYFLGVGLNAADSMSPLKLYGLLMAEICATKVRLELEESSAAPAYVG